MSKKITTLLSASLVLLTMLTIPGCDWFKKFSGTTAGVDTKEISFYLLDANPEDIYKDAHIPGALHVTLESVEKMSKNWKKDTPIVVYCSPACGTKDLVAKKLESAGFSNVKVYKGGITEWYKLSKENRAEYPLEGEAKHTIFEKETEPSVHKESTGSYIAADELKKQLQVLRT